MGIVPTSMRVLRLSNLNLTNNTIDLIFQVIEGDHFFEEDGVQKWERDQVIVGLVKIEGNEKTKDFVIRRELAISPENRSTWEDGEQSQPD